MAQGFQGEELLFAGLRAAVRDGAKRRLGPSVATQGERRSCREGVGLERYQVGSETGGANGRCEQQSHSTAKDPGPSRAQRGRSQGGGSDQAEKYKDREPWTIGTTPAEIGSSPPSPFR